MACPSLYDQAPYQLAKRIAAISTGEESDETPPINEKAAQRGKARAAKLTPAERRQIARQAARTRWKKKPPEPLG